MWIYSPLGQFLAHDLPELTLSYSKSLLVGNLVKIGTASIDFRLGVQGQVYHQVRKPDGNRGEQYRQKKDAHHKTKSFLHPRAGYEHTAEPHGHHSGTERKGPLHQSGHSGTTSQRR